MQFDNNLKLCYCDNNWAWFTTCPLDKQWGDDWNDAPYEHNAGEPYEWAEYRNIAPYNIVKVSWEGCFILPCYETLNSPYSVQMINRGDIAWLRPGYDNVGEDAKPIHAGTTLGEFVRMILAADGRVYVEVSVQ
jgi:hypothetical protein